MRIWYIHGANATPASFAFVKSMMPEHEAIDIVYSANDPIQRTIDSLALRLTEPTHIIAHSLGGNIAVALSQMKPLLVQSVTTMGTPFGGSETAAKLRFLYPLSVFLKNIASGNETMAGIRAAGAVVPTLKIITTSGANPFDSKPSDGVVSVESQEDLRNTTDMYVPFNHFEVLLDTTVIKAIVAFIQKHTFEEAVV